MAGTWSSQILLRILLFLAAALDDLILISHGCLQTAKKFQTEEMVNDDESYNKNDDVDSC